MVTHIGNGRKVFVILVDIYNIHNKVHSFIFSSSLINVDKILTYPTNGLVSKAFGKAFLSEP